jgi:hypothetical protein
LWLTEPPVRSQRQERLAWLTEAVLWGGIVILLTSVALYFVNPELGAPALALLVYFALAVALLSQARFSVTYAGWKVQGISIQAGIGRRWLLWVVLFLVGVTLLALFLPTHYTMGPLRALMGLISMVYSVLSFLLGLLLFLLMLPLMLLFPSMERPERPEMGPLIVPPAEAPVARTGSPLLEILGSALFWIVVLAIVGYALRRFLKERLGDLPDRDGLQGTWWGRLLAWLRDLWRRWLGWGEARAGRDALRIPGRAGPAVPRVGAGPRGPDRCLCRGPVQPAAGAGG